MTQMATSVTFCLMIKCSSWSFIIIWCFFVCVDLSYLVMMSKMKTERELCKVLFFTASFLRLRDVVLAENMQTLHLPWLSQFSVSFGVL